MLHAAASREIRRRIGEGPLGRAARPPGVEPTGRRARRQSGLIAVVALTAATIAPLSTAIRSRAGVPPTPAASIGAHARVGSIAPTTGIPLAAATTGIPPTTTAPTVGAPPRRATLVAGSTGAGPTAAARAATAGGGPRAPGRRRVRQGVRLRIAAPEDHQGQRQRRGQHSAMDERSNHGYVLLRDR
jgi:hypothetical protein